MAAKKTSLRDLALKSKSEGLAAANMAPVGNRIVELAPESVHAGGLADRFEIDMVELASLSESIRTLGQKVPILVRPHPERPGDYEIIAGRRRLAACKMAGVPVRAEIQDISHSDLVLAQAAENIAREDLTYIERAKLAARMVDEAGLQPADIDVAFSCGKTDRSRYLKIGRGIPDDILTFIGKAPGVGRPRWEKLAEILAEEGADERARKVMRAEDQKRQDLGTSEGRFDAILKAATPKSHKAPRAPSNRLVGDVWPNEDRPLGWAARDTKGVHLVLNRKDHRGLADWVSDNPEKVAELLLEAYAREHPDKAAGGKLAAANTEDLE